METRYGMKSMLNAILLYLGRSTVEVYLNTIIQISNDCSIFRNL